VGNLDVLGLHRSGAAHDSKGGEYMASHVIDFLIVVKTNLRKCGAREQRAAKLKQFTC
jgi:hypothetical protein